MNDKRWAFPKEKVNRILKNVRKVFKHENIEYLSKEAYDFIILKMGFIAHYNLHGFCGFYSNFNEFAKNLLTSEYSRSENFNMVEAEVPRQCGVSAR